MVRRLWTVALMVGLGFGVLAALPTSAADSADAAKIKQLVEKLGSSTFDEREQATKDLDAIGAPALEALRKASKSDDAEVSRRSADLVKAIEKRTESQTVLKPTKIHLVFKDTPVAEAVAELKKKTGYNIVLQDTENKLKDRTITLDTGETTFWQAFDQFCDKAGLHEATQQELLNIIRPNPLPPNGLPGQPINPPPPAIRLQPTEIKPPEKAPAGQVPADKPAKPSSALAADDNPAPATRPAAQPPVGGPAAAQPAIAPPVIRPLPVRTPQQPGQITLIDGKAEAQPTDYSTAVRVRAMTKEVATYFGNAEEGTLLLGLQITPEPKITWQNLVAVKVDKAIDDNEQKLAEAPLPMVPGFPGGGVQVLPGGAAPAIRIARPPIRFGGFASLTQMVPVRLKKGEKASKTIKELTGTISAEVLAEPKTLITTDEIMKSAGKTFKGDEGGSIKIVSVDKDENGSAKVIFELEQPAGFVVPNNGPIGVGPIPRPVPLPRLPNPPVQPPGAGFQAQAGQAQQVPPGQPIQIQVQVQVGGGAAAPAIAAPFIPAGNGTNGLKLVDDKGNVVPGYNIGVQYKAPPGGGRVVAEWVLTFPVKKDQAEVGKLIFAASKSVTVDIPFTLKDIVLP